MPTSKIILLVSLLLGIDNGLAQAGFDHRVHKETGGIWQAHYNLPVALGATLALGALWEGDQSRSGRAMWQSVDAYMMSELLTSSLKYTLNRKRPRDTNDPGLWFQGKGNYSFPSGHTSSATALLTPIILEYGPDHPWVYGLAIVPIYMAAGRVKAQAHWQTDVLAGLAVGASSGYFAHTRKEPLVFVVLPRKIELGIKHSF